MDKQKFNKLLQRLWLSLTVRESLKSFHSIVKFEQSTDNFWEIWNAEQPEELWSLGILR